MVLHMTSWEDMTVKIALVAVILVLVVTKSPLQEIWSLVAKQNRHV